MNISAFQDAYLSRINTISQSEEINLHVANALRFVIQNVFANITNAFVFTISTSGGAVAFWLHDTMSKLFTTWGLIAVQLVVVDSKIRQLDIPGIRYCNMIMIDSFESLERTNIAEYNRNSDSLEYYYIFLQSPDNMFENEMKKISRYCFDNYWIHCNIMVQNSKGEVLVYTFFPFKENNCFKTKPELINRFVGEKFENDLMFPDKLKDLQGCPLKLSTWETPPFVFNATNKRNPNLQVAGFEIFTLITFSQKINFTLDVEWLGIETYEKNMSPETEPLSKVCIYNKKHNVI